MDVDRYKLVILLNCFHLSDEQRTQVTNRLLNRNRTVVWCYATGLFNGPAVSLQSMCELTGLKLVRATTEECLSATISLTEQGRQLWPDPTSAPATIGRPEVRGQMIFVDDPDAQVWGTWQGRPETALALKQIRDWNSVYTINPVLPAAFYRALARRAGVHLYHEQDDTLYVNRSYLTLSADAAGRRQICLPQPCRICNPFTDETLWNHVTTFAYDFRAKETVIWRLT